MMNETVTHKPKPSIQRLAFAAFDAPPPPPPVFAPEISAPPAPPPPPIFTQADVEAARQEAHSAGYSEGISAAQAAISARHQANEDAVRDLLDVISNRITLAAESHTDYLRRQQPVMARLILAAARKIAGDALKRDTMAGIEQLLRECADIVAGERRIVISVPPSVAATGLAQRLDTLRLILDGFEGEILLQEDETLGPQDCRVEWKNGTAERSEETMWKEIEAIIARSVSAKDNG